LVLASVAETRDPLALARLFDAAEADLVQATPATWRMLCESGWTGRPGMRVVCGGEGYGADLVKELLERVGEVWNFYGPTEATVWSVCTRLDHDVADPVPMGRPIANTSCYVLDENRRPVPLGVPGELYLGGVGLARGYLGRPELTEERFVADPFSSAPGARMYRTGDLVRYRGDATLVFIGRTDHQVKLRGFRIELGEIESALTAQEGIAQAVVIVREDDPGDRRLVAYVVGSGSPFEHATLHEELRRLVPAYMVPSAIVTLDQFPLTPNGKLDRKALPEPEWGQGNRELVDPRDELETEVAAVCHEVFGSQPFGVTDNFFDLGFDSIMAARLFTRIERTFGSELPLATIFQAPTVAQLANLLRDRTALEGGSKWSALVPIRVGGRRRPFFGVHGGAGTSLLFYPLAHLMDAEQPFYGLQAVGLYGRETPQRSVEAMASRYISEIKSVQPHGPYALGGYCFGGLVAYEMAVQLLAAGEAIELVAMFNAPSASYNERFNPVFDNEGALTDHRGELVERIATRGSMDRTLRGSIVRQLSQTRGLSIPSRVGAIATAATERLRAPAIREARKLRCAVALHLHRPLPDGLREANAFQRIARSAQDRYRPPKADVPIIVYRAEGLYYEPALGWDEFSKRIIDCFEVPGDQPVPRRTMREPCVSRVAMHLTSHLSYDAGFEPHLQETGPTPALPFKNSQEVH
jgi:thioesterase domain-containing protein/acyl carrier protein